jgi:hypothetical protein
LVVIPAVFTRTLVVVLVPPARFEPVSAESETYEGVPAARAALQFKGWPPVLLMVIGTEAVPEETL